MSAIVTTKFRLENAAAFIGSATTSSLYVGIGKSDAWSQTDVAPAPADTIVEENDFWANAIAFKRVLAANIINIAPRYTWTSGTSYVPWNDADEDIFTKQFYAINSNNNCCYKCIIAGASSSTVEPDHTTGPAPKFYSDGYAWQYMFALDSDLATKFLMSNYMPVKVATNASGVTPTEQANYAYQQDCLAAKGRIYRYIVTDGGSLYNSTPAVTVSGNGTGATAVAIVNPTTKQVTSVIVTDTNTGNIATNTTNLSNNAGSNYTTAYVTIAAPGGGGTTATAVAVLSPGEGHGTDPVTELGGYYVGIRSLLTGAEGSGDFIVNNLFRQIGLVKNPYEYDSETVATDNTLSALTTLDLGTSVTHVFTVGDVFEQISGTGTGAKGYVDSFELKNDGHYYLKYHQNDSTGYKAVTDDGNIQSTNGALSGLAAVDSITFPEVQPYSGKVLFVENRAPISRTASQIEDIRLILEF